jgi:hypothetical protein
VITPFALIAGAVLALALVRVAGTREPDAARRVYAVGLVVAARVYVAFAAAHGSGGRWLALEGLGVLLYGAAAWVGLRRRVALALGWAAHVGWDVLLHSAEPGAAYTPTWYPWLCVGFDLVVAAAVLAPRRRGGLLGSRPVA